MLRAEGLMFGWQDALPLLDGVSIDLGPGWTGLVGANGAGKSTLLRLLDGTLTPEQGRVRREGPVHRCVQEVGERTAAVEAFAWGWTGPEAWALQRLLGLEPAQLDRWEVLSPGQRRRWQLGAAVAAKPAVLLLDEPTNHLDPEGRDALTALLGAYPGVGVLVSHDRALLDAVCVRTARLHRGALDLLELPYAEASAVWRGRRAAAEARRDAASHAARAARARAHATAQKARQAEAARGKVRVQGVHDSDARTAMARNQAEWGAAAAARGAKHARRDAAAAEAARQEAAVERELGADVHLPGRPAAQAIVTAFQGDLRSPDGAVLVPALDVQVPRDARLWVRGANGAGKSTLLRALADATPLPPDRVLHLQQRVDPDVHVRRLADLQALPPHARGEVLTAAAALGLDPAKLLQTGTCSPGEARKLAMAFAMGREASLLILDEPTNDLDLPAVERLEAALGAWTGALVLVTHDVRLGDAVGREQLALTRA